MALRRLSGMNGATAASEETTTGVARHSEPHAVSRAIDVLRLKYSNRQAEESGDAWNVSLGQINKTFLTATLGTSRLALEAHPLGHDLLWTTRAHAGRWFGNSLWNSKSSG